MSNPTPWTVKVDFGIKRFCQETGKPIQPFNYYWVKDANGHSVTLFHGNETSGDSERAELIVRAVNCHEEMLAALKAARRVVQMVATQSDLLTELDALIAKADGK